MTRWCAVRIVALLILAQHRLPARAFQAVAGEMLVAGSLSEPVMIIGQGFTVCGPPTGS
jgi:hypothetical protein